MATTEMKSLEAEVAAAVKQKPHWSVRLYVTKDERNGALTETRQLIPVSLSLWSRICLRLAGFRVEARDPRPSSPGLVHRIRGKGANGK